MAWCRLEDMDTGLWSHSASTKQDEVEGPVFAERVTLRPLRLGPPFPGG